MEDNQIINYYGENYHNTCPQCSSTAVVAKKSSDTTHYASLHCSKRDRFLGWLEKPENTQQREQENSLISDLLLSPKLNGWERMFLRSVLQTKKRSPRQREKWRQIAERLEMRNDLQALRISQGCGGEG